MYIFDEFVNFALRVAPAVEALPYEWACATGQGMVLTLLSLEGMQFTVPI